MDKDFAKKLKAELIESALNDVKYKNLESWIVKEFKKGVNPVYITSGQPFSISQEIRDFIKEKNPSRKDLFYLQHIEIKDDRYFLCGIDVTDTEIPCAYYAGKEDANFKMYHLQALGFKCLFYWEYGKGDRIEVRLP